MQVKINGAKYVTQADTRVLIDALSQPLSYQVLLLSDEENWEMHQTPGYLMGCPWCGVNFPLPPEGGEPACPNCGTMGVDTRLPHILDSIPTAVRQYRYHYTDTATQCCGEAFDGILFGGPLSDAQIAERLREWAPRHFGDAIPNVLEIKEEVIITVCRAERYVGRFNM